MPTYRDLYLTCSACQNTFLLTGVHRQALREAKLPLPERCPGCAALSLLTARRSGSLKSYDRRRGFGFIQGDDGSSLFVHASALGAGKGRFPAVGSRLTFYVEHTTRGPRAVAVEFTAPGESPAGL